MKNEILLITDQFPSDPSGRSEKMFRHARYTYLNDMNMHVVCPKTLNAPNSDGLFSGSIKCWRVTPWLWNHLNSLFWHENFRPVNKLGELYARSFFPGGYLRWFFPAFFFCYRLIKSRGIQVVVTVSNPITMHLIGMALKACMPNIKLVAELRDPIVGYYRSRHNEHLMKIMEICVSRFAAKVIEWADFCPDPITHRISGLEKKYVRIQNVGYDDKDYEGYQETISYGDELRLVYTGGYYGEKKLWCMMLEAISSIVEKGEKIRVDYYGVWSKDQETVREKIKDQGSSWLHLHGTVPKRVCVNACQESHAQIFLLKTDDDNKGRISSKIYDYFASQRPIIGLVPKNSMVEKKINQNPGNYLLGLDDHWENEYNSYKEQLMTIITQLIEDQQSRKLTFLSKDMLKQYSCGFSEREWVDTVKGLIS